MWSGLVEVRDVHIEDALELPLMEDQQVVQAFLPHAPQEAFADGIGSWRMIRGFEHLNPTGGRHPSETGPKFTIVITNQILGCLPIGGSFSQVLGHPGIGRRSSDSDMDYPSGLEFDEEEGKERPKEEISHLQEVTRPDLSCVSAQKGCPRLSSWLGDANSSHVLLDGSFAHPDAQFQKFSTNALSSPESILPRHLPDQGNGFWSNFLLVSMRLGLALPVQAKELPMPAQQGIGLHDHQGLLPGTNQPGQQDEEDAIGPGDGWPFHLPPENDELLS